jgi:ribosomal protein S27E
VEYSISRKNKGKFGKKKYNERKNSQVIFSQKKHNVLQM